MASSISVGNDGLKISKKSGKTKRTATVGPGGGSIGISRGPVEIKVNSDGSVGGKISAGPISIKGDSDGNVGIGIQTPVGGIDYNSDGSGSITAPLGIAKMEVERKGCVYIKRTYLAGTLIDTEYQQIEDCEEEPPDPPDPDNPKHEPPKGENDKGLPLPPPLQPPIPGKPGDFLTILRGWQYVGGYINDYSDGYTYIDKQKWNSTVTLAGEVDLTNPVHRQTLYNKTDNGTMVRTVGSRTRVEIRGSITKTGHLTINEPGGSFTEGEVDPGGTAGLHWYVLASMTWEDWSENYTGILSFVSDDGTHVVYAQIVPLAVLVNGEQPPPPSPPSPPIEHPPPPPPIMSNCCKESKVDLARVEEALERLEQVIGTREILDHPQGFGVPNKMLIPGGDGYSYSKNYLNIFTWLFASIDRYGFDGPIIVDIADTDKGKAGDQGLKIQVNSLSTAIQTLLSLAVENKGDQATRLNIQIRLAFMLTRLMRMMHKMYYLVVAILEGLGIPTIKKRIKDIPFEFNLNPDDLGFGKKAEKLDTMNEDELEAQLPKILDTKEMDLIVEQFKPNQLDLRGFLLKLINKK